GFNIFFLIICRKYFSHHPDSVFSFLYSKKIGVGYVFISNLLANIINFICMLPIIFKSKLEFNFKLWKRIIAYSLPLLIAGFGGNMNEAADRVLLKYLLPSNVNSMEQLGLFGANIKVAVLMTLFIQMFRFAAEPFFFNREKDKNSKKLFADVTKYFIIFGLFIFLGVTLYMGIVKYFIGVEYRKGLFIVPTLLMANLFLGIYFNLSMWYKLNNMTKFGAILAIVGAVITLAINIIFVPIYGYGACAWAHLFCYLGMVSLSYYLSRKYYLIKYDFKNITFYFILALSLFFISRFVGIKSLLLNLVFNTFLLAIYVWIVMKREGLKKLFVKS
ncbi:MAG: polysaccharide biosynthesis C-terminal domain-containing protein, partial [Bacteroidota bacterium]|nr:polysaccharide biosynthesis C-terminal domain-containing protein [Bacteroidota bacterium]